MSDDYNESISIINVGGIWQPTVHKLQLRLFVNGQRYDRPDECSRKKKQISNP